MKDIKFDGWTITYSPKPIPSTDFDYEYYHEDHDGSIDGTPICGSGPSVSSCINKILSTYYVRSGDI